MNEYIQATQLFGYMLLGIAFVIGAEALAWHITWKPIFESLERHMRVQKFLEDYHGNEKNQ